MKRTAVILAFIACFATNPAQAIWEVTKEGAWSKTWPKELEPLRKQSRTLVGGLVNMRVHEIPFTEKEEFEAAWSHILKVKSQGAPIILLPAAKKGKRFFGGFDAGVVIRQPPKSDKPQPEKPLPGDRSIRQTWMWTTYIELVVDGNVVDLNTIGLPKDTPIIDERFD